MLPGADRRPAEGASLHAVPMPSTVLNCPMATFDVRARRNFDQAKPTFSVLLLGATFLGSLLVGCGTAPSGEANSLSNESLIEAVEQSRENRLEQLGLAALDYFQDTWNTREVAVWSRSLHFPHVRPSAGQFSVYPTADEYAEGHIDVFKNVLALGWHRSQWENRRILQISADKMHIAGEYARYRENGEQISTQQVTYVVTRQRGRWAIQARLGTGKVDSGEEAASETGPARQAVEEFFTALNSLDPQALAGTLHFPHVRLGASGLEFWRDEEEFQSGTEPGRQRTWRLTAVESIEPIQIGSAGVNLAVRFLRENSSGEALSAYEAVFLVTRRNSKWAVQARSTFAP